MESSPTASSGVAKIDLSRWLFAAVLVTAGAPLAAGGAYLAVLGGSLYYVLAGTALVVSAVLLAKGRRAGAWLYGVVVLTTIAWAIGEVGFRPWMLLPRLAGPLVLALWLLTPWPRRGLEGSPEFAGSKAVMVLLAGGVLALLVGWAAHRLAPPLPVDPIYRTGTIAAPAPNMAPVETSGEWTHYGNDQGGSRFSPLTEITPANVSELRVAWTFKLGGDRDGAMPMMEVTPLMVDGLLYPCTAYGDVIALDAETGAERWRFKSGLASADVPYGQCRGVAYYKTPNAEGLCSARILFGVGDARLIALDAATGQRCPEFGQNGQVSLLDGMGPVEKGYYFVTSAPAVVRGKVVVGGWVTDGQYWGEPSGVVRAFDAVTGALSWAFDAGRPDRQTLPPPGEIYTRSTPNSWAPMSADEDLGLVYVPTGNSTPDYFGALRRPFDEQVASSVVAIDATSGKVAWVFQTTHHDIWDYDIPSQPTLVDIRTKDGVRPALVQATKRGELFVLDRTNGQPLLPVSEVPVPQNNRVAEEWLAPTQPFAVGMPSTAGPEPAERTMWGMTPLDQLWCRIRFREMVYAGPFTPPGTKTTIIYPGVYGANSWGSVSVDKDRNLLIATGFKVSTVATLIPRSEAAAAGLEVGEKTAAHVGGANPQVGAPYAAQVDGFMSPLKAPCESPPYGTISAIDLASGKLVWTKPIGTAARSGPFGISSHLPFLMGAPLTGGAVVTRGGLTMIGASQDRMLRVYETATGRLLWRHELPAAGMATPATYRSPTSGRQFVVIAAGGHRYIPAPAGDYIVAFALPPAR